VLPVTLLTTALGATEFRLLARLGQPLGTWLFRRVSHAPYKDRMGIRGSRRAPGPGAVFGHTPRDFRRLTQPPYSPGTKFLTSDS